MIAQHKQLALTFNLLAIVACAQVAQAHTLASTAAPTDLVQVPTTSGLIQGFRRRSLHQSSGNQSVIKFLSVPYAKAPVDQLRFKRPIALLSEENSTKLVDATRYGKTCPQYRHLARFISPLLNLDYEHQTSEDCLRLSIYVPSFVESTLVANGTIASDNVQPLRPSKLLPVIVWIPGEGFDFADERQFDGSHLAQQTQSIVVSVQYRVGILGFLSEPQLNITGNMGAYDQLAALKWVSKNIGAFGGDEQRVTLMGRFSGSMSISAMLTAPKQKLNENETPLFNRAILLSGLAVKDWIIEEQQNERVQEVLEEAIRRNYCTQAQVEARHCLQTMATDKLIEISGYGWKLVIDEELVGRQDPIEMLREHPERLTPNVEAILLGETETEGTLCLYRHLLNQQSDYAKLIDEDRLTNDDLFDMIRDDSATYFKYNISRTNPIQEALELLTSAGNEINSGNNNNNNEQLLREKYLDACSAYMVKSHNGRFKRHLQARNKLVASSVSTKPVDIFHYSLKYKPSFSLAPEYIQTAAHGDDVPLIFGLVYNQPQHLIDQADLLMTHRMMSYIGNFVHGNHPLLQQHNSIEHAAKANSIETSNSDGQKVATIGRLARPASAMESGTTARSSWTDSSNNQIHSLALTDSDSAYLAASQRQSPVAATTNSDEKVALISEQDLIKLLGMQQQLQVQQTASRQADGAQLKVVVLPDGQQVVALVSSNQAEVLANLAAAQQSQQVQLTAEERQQQQRRAMTRSLRLMDFHNRHQLLQDRTNIQATTTTTTTTNLFGAEISFVSSLVFSSCIVILMLMSICIILSAIVIRNNLSSA